MGIAVPAATATTVAAAAAAAGSMPEVRDDWGSTGSTPLVGTCPCNPTSPAGDPTPAPPATVVEDGAADKRVSAGGSGEEDDKPSETGKVIAGSGVTTGDVTTGATACCVVTVVVDAAVKPTVDPADKLSDSPAVTGAAGTLPVPKMPPVLRTPPEFPPARETGDTPAPAELGLLIALPAPGGMEAVTVPVAAILAAELVG